MADFFRRRELAFQLHELHGLEEVLRYPRYAQHDRDSCDAMLDAAHALARDHFLPHAARADAEEPHFDGERVHQPAEVKAALQAYIDGGFLSASFAAEAGGLQLPALVSSAMGAIFTAANAGTAGYVFLTQAAARLLLAHASADQQARYMQPMLAGRYFGTMCLSEPQAGSSLADIRTRATPLSDGRYQITGNKMWISGGEHELSENIVHLVLARIEGAPAGVKGISLFIVPKRRVNADGSTGARNGVRLMGLNHKLGYRGTTNCALAFGEGEECIGELIGEPHQGLRYMFHMMNEARIGVGLGAVAMGMAGYLYSLEYTQQRPQGRLPAEKNPLAAPVMIAEHADVRRMLLLQKSYVEGGLALCLFGARLLDEQQCSPEAANRAEAGQLLDLLTPIIKAWPSEFCLEANKLAIQCLGGYGYTRDYPVERLYRDNRLNPIHEGTNGIQGLDLLGRKVMGDGGKALGVLNARINATLKQIAAASPLAEYATALRAALERLNRVSMTLGAAAAKGQLNLALAHSNAYLELFGHTVVAWLWLQQALVAAAAQAAAAAAERDYYAGKLAACHLFYLYELPKTGAQADLLLRLDASLLDLAVAQL